MSKATSRAFAKLDTGLKSPVCTEIQAEIVSRELRLFLLYKSGSIIDPTLH
jgi:hypothetical protein